jgi:uncharacterized membrane protein YgcG
MRDTVFLLTFTLTSLLPILHPLPHDLLPLPPRLNPLANLDSNLTPGPNHCRQQAVSGSLLRPALHSQIKVLELVVAELAEDRGEEGKGGVERGGGEGGGIGGGGGGGGRR